ncbi:CehA/McbA family metallohydrolase [Candidatus Latescibacterota bacterium]
MFKSGPGIIVSHSERKIMLSYAEFHYRPLRYFPSLIFKKQPEILFDIPGRIEPGCPIPVFLIIKDADLYPVEIDSVIIHARYENGIERIARFPYNGLRVDSKIWWDSINITSEYTGMVKIDPYVSLKIGKKMINVRIDNYKGISREPLNVFVSTDSLPASIGWYHGDIHCHTFYTSDQIEFGAPLEVMAFAAYCMGLSWMAATDHSYDLDNKTNSYESKDPMLAKWDSMKKNAELLVSSLTVIPGEEVTVRNEKGANCHMLALNSSKFIKGTGDSGQNGLSTKTEKSIGEAASECVEWGGIACAAHPLENIPVIEKLILGRGKWSIKDIQTPGVTAIQFYNGIRDRGFHQGKKAWIKLLLNGRRIYAFGGNDAHGDMNRRRRIEIPLVSISERFEHIFGNVRTVVRAKSKERHDITEALINGHAQVTDGPFIDINISLNDTIAYPGDVFSTDTNTDLANTGEEIVVNAIFMSTPELGSLKRVLVYGGAKKESPGNENTENKEIIIMTNDISTQDFEYKYSESFAAKGFLYIRAECETSKGKICFTNPIWIDSAG